MSAEANLIQTGAGGPRKSTAETLYDAHRNMADMTEVCVLRASSGTTKLDRPSWHG